MVLRFVAQDDIMSSTKQEGDNMNSTYGIRLQAIKEHFSRDSDNLRFSRELSRLQIDVARTLKRCLDAGDESCSELEDLNEYLMDEIDHAMGMRGVS